MLDLAKNADDHDAAKQSLVKILEDLSTKLTPQISSVTSVASDFGTFSAALASDIMNYHW